MDSFLAYCSICCITIMATDGVTLTFEMKSVIPVKGLSLEFSCHMSEPFTTNAIVIWNENLEVSRCSGTSYRCTFFETGYFFTSNTSGAFGDIGNLTTEDEGTWKCSYRTTAGDVFSNSWDLTVYNAVTLTFEMKKNMPLKGSSLEFSCRMSDLFTANAIVIWKGNLEVTRCSGTSYRCTYFKTGYIFSSNTSGSFGDIGNLTTEDEGTWKCSYRTTAGDVFSNSWDLIVYTLPSGLFFKHTSSQDVDLSEESVEFVCITDNCTYPIPSVIWIFKDQAYMEYVYQTSIPTGILGPCTALEMIYESTLTLLQYTTFTNNGDKSGNFFCRVEYNGTSWNINSSASDAVRFSVVNTVRVLLPNQRGMSGDPLELTCLLIPRPGAVITGVNWIRGSDENGIQLDEATCNPIAPSLYDLTRYSFACNSSANTFKMTIMELQRSDEGLCWACSVSFSNFAETDKSSPACIKLQDGDNMELTSGSATVGKPVTLQCAYVGSYNPYTINFFMGSGALGLQINVDTCNILSSTSYYISLYDRSCGVKSVNLTIKSVTAADIGTTWYCDATFVSGPGYIAKASTTITAPSTLNYDLRLQFDLKVDLDFKDEYEDRSSPEFQSLATDFSVSLTQSFRLINGFKSIEILQFRAGSVIVDYTVNVYPTVDILAVTKQIEDEVVDSLNVVAGYIVDTEYTQSSVKRQLQSLRTRDRCSLASAIFCPFGHYCKSVGRTTLLCIDRCNVSVCENNGSCYIGHLNQDVQCRCPNSNGAVFTGERCEVRQAVMTIQEIMLYSIIACSIFSAVIVSFVLTVCFINRKRSILKKKLSANLRMKEVDRHSADVNYSHDDSNKPRQNILIETVNQNEEGKAQYVNDGSLNSVKNLEDDEGYLRPVTGSSGIEDSEYNYIT